MIAVVLLYLTGILAGATAACAYTVSRRARDAQAAARRASAAAESAESTRLRIAVLSQERP